MSNPVSGSRDGISAEAAANLAYREFIRAYPGMLMKETSGRIRDAAGQTNKWLFPTIATAEATSDVRVDPDVLHSYLCYDVTETPLLLTVPISRAQFWSLTLIADNAEAFFALDNVQLEGKTVELLILGPGHAVPSRENTRVVASPSGSGIAVVRAVVPRLDQLRSLDRARKRAKAAPADSD